MLCKVIQEGGKMGPRYIIVSRAGDWGGCSPWVRQSKIFRTRSEQI